MSSKSFIFQLCTISLICFILSFSAGYIPIEKELIQLSLLSTLFFSLFCIGIYFKAKAAIDSPNKYAFNNIIILSIAAKMFVSILFLLIYKKLLNPQSHYFVVPFLIIYVVYTIFETYFMTKLSNPNNKAA